MIMNTSTLIKKANRLLVKKANELLAAYDINHAYTFFLMELYQQDGLTQSELRKRIGIEQPTAVRTLDRMERDGFINREQNPNDRRALHIKLTEKGRNLEETILNAAKELNKLALQGFSKDEQQMLLQLIQRVNSNLQD